MDGLFQLLLLGFFVAASIFDGVARKRKKEEQKDRLDREEAGGQVVPRKRPEPMRPRPTADGRRKAPTGEPAPRAQAEGERRTTADQMIPEDFWAVLTGQAPVQREDVEVGPEPELVQLPTTASESEPWRAPVPDPDPDESATRRSSRWMEGLGQEEDRRARESVERTERQAWAAPVAAAALPRRADPMDEPWGALEDISRGEIGDGRGAVQGAVDLTGGAGTRRYGASDSPYVRLVASGRQEDLKAAIVLREVLGSPVGSRHESEAPGGWRWDGP